MEIINLSNRREIEININGKECIISLALKNIQHFQEVNKMGLQKALGKMKDGDIDVILKLIYSMTSDKKTGKVLSVKFWKDFDELSVLESLSPFVEQLLLKEMPEAKNKSEKK